MTTHRWGRIGTAVIMLAAGIAVGAALDRALVAQQSGITRSELTRLDVPPGAPHEAVMAIAEIAPGSSSGRHFHNGVELGYVLDGELFVERADGSTATYTKGQAFKNPTTEVHNARNRGTSPTRLLTVYIVEKGKPLAEPARPGR
jgi:quercetin dioxygenase-like cupin family protein